MLIEKDVSAYSTWEKELQKIVFDPRYLLLTSKERKQVFDKYVKDRANQESKERAAALKKKRDDFKDLLKEANISLKSSSSSFTDFASKYARDERFKGIEKMKDRESIFNDYLSDLRKQEKEEKYAEKEKLKKNFYAMLKEFKSLHRHSSWSETKKQLESDPRYKAIDSSSKREDYFRDYCKYLDEKPNGDSKSSHKDKQKDKSDDKSSKHSSSKMDQDDLDNSKNDGSAAENEKMDEDEEMDEDEKRKELEKQERVSASLRERNKEVKEQLSRIQNEREKERDQLKRDETIECFKALLIDIIKPSVASTTTTTTTAPASTDSKSETSKSVCTTELSWKEAKKILKRDSRWSYCKLLEKEKKEQLFEEHMNKFRAKKREIFYQLLDETSGVSLSSTWKEVKKLIKGIYIFAFLY
jgi:transcription elongation regulator 1